VTTRGRRHSRTPLRSSATTGKVLSSGLAAATCVGILGIIGVRSSDDSASGSPETAETSAPVAPASQTAAPGLTREQLDEYAASLAQEKKRLDDYRTKLITTAEQIEDAAAGASRPATSR
jgi:hypothetical protein